MHITESGAVIRSKWRWGWKRNFMFSEISFYVSYCSERLLADSSTNCPEPHALPLSDYRIFTSPFFFESWQHNSPGQCQIIICTLTMGAELLYESEEDKNSTLKARQKWLNKGIGEKDRDLNAVCWAGWFFLPFNFFSPLLIILWISCSKTVSVILCACVCRAWRLWLEGKFQIDALKYGRWKTEERSPI